jgi:hypothetical protein
MNVFTGKVNKIVGRKPDKTKRGMNRKFIFV